MNLTDEMLRDFESRRDSDFVFLGDIPGTDRFAPLRVFGHRDRVFTTTKPIDELVAKGYMKEKEMRELRRFERLRKLGEAG